MEEDKNLGDKTWNNRQKVDSEKEFNEGFSNENIPDDYNPSDVKTAQNLKNETEVDDEGHSETVKRARFAEDKTGNVASKDGEKDDNTNIENPESLQNRDRNYDSQPNRYSSDHPDNHKNRGNIELDNE